MVSRIPAHRASAPAELRRSRAIGDQAEALVEVAIPHRNKLWHRHISRQCSGATDEPRHAPSPHWERALSLNEPKASLGKESEGPAPTSLDSRTQTAVGERCFFIDGAGPSPSLLRLASSPRQTILSQRGEEAVASGCCPFFCCKDER